MNGLSAAGYTVGDKVVVNARSRSSHGWCGNVDGFSEEVPGILRIVVLFERDHGAKRILMTFKPKELMKL